MSMIPISPVDIYEGNNVIFYTSSKPTANAPVGAFLTAVPGGTGVAFDPDIVEFSYIVQGKTAVVHTYTQGSGDPDNVIIRVATGEYQATIPTTGQVGRWVWRWAGYPNPSGPVNPNAAAVEGIINVLANDVD